MRKIFGMTAGVAFIGMSGFALAADDRASAAEEKSGFYGSAGISRLDLDFGGANFTNSAGEIVSPSVVGLDFDSVRLISFAAGYNWGRWAMELGYEHSIGSGDLKSKQSNAHGDFEYGNFKVAAAYRSSGTLYFLGKVGLSIPNIDNDVPGLRLKMGDSAFAGFGVGYRFSPVWSVEAEATRSKDDTTTYTLSLRRKF